MAKLADEFISKEHKRFKFKIGRTLASSLSGFLGGVIFMSIAWGTVLYILYKMCQDGLK